MQICTRLCVDLCWIQVRPGVEMSRPRSVRAAIGSMVVWRERRDCNQSWKLFENFKGYSIVYCLSRVSQQKHVPLTLVGIPLYGIPYLS